MSTGASYLDPIWGFLALSVHSSEELTRQQVWCADCPRGTGEKQWQVGTPWDRVAGTRLRAHQLCTKYLGAWGWARRGFSWDLGNQSGKQDGCRGRTGVPCWERWER